MTMTVRVTMFLLGLVLAVAYGHADERGDRVLADGVVAIGILTVVSYLLAEFFGYQDRVIERNRAAERERQLQRALAGSQKREKKARQSIAACGPRRPVLEATALEALKDVADAPRDTAGVGVDSRPVSPADRTTAGENPPTPATIPIKRDPVRVYERYVDADPAPAQKRWRDRVLDTWLPGRERELTK